MDDSKFLTLANSKALFRAGYKVITASDGEEALCLARKMLPDIIILDILLPKLSGLDVLRFLKKDPATKHIPVVVLSSLSKINEEKLVEDGAAAFVEKSSLENDNTEILLKAVDRAQRRAQRSRP